MFTEEGTCDWCKKPSFVTRHDYVDGKYHSSCKSSLRCKKKTHMFYNGRCHPQFQHWSAHDWQLAWPIIHSLSVFIYPSFSANWRLNWMIPLAWLKLYKPSCRVIWPKGFFNLIFFRWYNTRNNDISAVKLILTLYFVFLQGDFIDHGESILRSP